MPSETPEPTEADSGTGEIKNLLSQTGALADRVAKLRDGPRKARVRDALLELQVIAEELKRDTPPTD
jgi:hypothetical protein